MKIQDQFFSTNLVTKHLHLTGSMAYINFTRIAIRHLSIPVSNYAKTRKNNAIAAGDGQLIHAILHYPINLTNSGDLVAVKLLRMDKS